MKNTILPIVLIFSISILFGAIQYADAALGSEKETEQKLSDLALPENNKTDATEDAKIFLSTDKSEYYHNEIITVSGHVDGTLDDEWLWYSVTSLEGDQVYHGTTPINPDYTFERTIKAGNMDDWISGEDYIIEFFYLSYSATALISYAGTIEDIVTSPITLPVDEELSPDIIVDTRNYPDTNVDLSFDKYTNTVLVQWDLGDNPQRDGCYSIGTIISNPGSSYEYLYGYTIIPTALDDHTLTNDNAQRMEIDCKGEVSFDFDESPDVVRLVSDVFYYEHIKPEYQQYYPQYYDVPSGFVELTLSTFNVAPTKPNSQINTCDDFDNMFSRDYELDFSNYSMSYDIQHGHTFGYVEYEEITRQCTDSSYNIPPIQSLIDLDYNESTRQVTIQWDLGENPHRGEDGCYITGHILSIRDFDSGEGKLYISGDDIITDKTYTNISNYQKENIAPCEGVISFNLDDDNLLLAPDQVYTEIYFYEDIDPEFYDLYSYYNKYQKGIYEASVAIIDLSFDKTENPIYDCALYGYDNFSIDIHQTTLAYNPTTGSDITYIDYYADTNQCYDSYSPSIELETYDIPKKKGGGCSGDCTPPTFGNDENNRKLVEGGFSYNGQAIDVTEFWTPYDLVTAQTGEVVNFTIKAYENNGLDNIKWIQFGIVPEVGTPLNDAEILATFHLKSSMIDEIVEEEKYDLFDIVAASTYVEECGYITSDCLELSIDVMFNEELINKVIVIDVIDNPRNSNTKYLNDGIETVGESINEPLINSVSVSNGGAFYPQRAGTVELVLTSYKNSEWQDEYGYMWKEDFENHTFRIISDVPQPQKEADLMWSAMTRMNSNFDAIIQYEQDRALLVFDSSKLVSVPGESFAYDLPKSEELQQAELDIRISDEIKRIASLSFVKDYTN